VWEIDRRVYALLLFVWALLLVASLATVSPEEPEPMYLIRHSELLSLRDISERLREDSGMLKNEAASWKQNSEALEIELESSTLEISALQNELHEQKTHLTELGNMLAESQNQVIVFRELVMELGTRATDSMQLSKQLQRDLSRMRLERNIWRIVGIVSSVLAATGWTMILYWP
jgi:hypothetical protein